MDRQCILIFDEMSIQPHLSFNAHTGEVGFEDFGDSQSNKIADHVLVFMVRGITKKVETTTMLHSFTIIYRNYTSGQEDKADYL